MISFQETVRRIRRRLDRLVGRRDNIELCDLIWHAWVHSGYADCGYAQMTREQKALFDSVIGRETPNALAQADAACGFPA